MIIHLSRVITVLASSLLFIDGVSAASFTPLGDLDGGNFSSRAEGVSYYGDVVVGTSESNSGTEAFRWTPDGPGRHPRVLSPRASQSGRLRLERG